jgi:hypothetical protein
MSKSLVIGPAGLLGSAVVAAPAKKTPYAPRAPRLKKSTSLTQNRSPRSLPPSALDGVVCTGGAARFKPYDQQNDEDCAFCLANKLMGQINVVRTVRRW